MSFTGGITTTFRISGYPGFISVFALIRDSKTSGATDLGCFAGSTLLHA